MSDDTHGTPGRDEPSTKQEQLRVLEEGLRKQEERVKRMSEPTPRNIALVKILGARTPEQIDRARTAIKEWIEEYPEDEMEFGRYASDLLRKEDILACGEVRRASTEDASSKDPSGPEASTSTS